VGISGEEAAMTNPNSPLGAAVAANVAANVTDAEIAENQNTGPTVGASDADADAARAGADVDLDDATRDSDSVPVGRADAEADAQRGRPDPD
jgi:hypothetical protein